MATIDKLDISVYNLYALRTRMIEQINQEFRFQEASSIPPQTQVLDVYPKLSELDLLLGIVPVSTPWALFMPPSRFQKVRRSPFSFSRVAPSLGNFDQHEEDVTLIEEVKCHTADEKKEKEAMLACFSQIEKINDWLGFIIGRIGQFLQG